MHCLSHLLRLFVTLICNPRVLRQGFTTPYNYLGSQTLTLNYSGWNIRRDKFDENVGADRRVCPANTSNAISGEHTGSPLRAIMRSTKY